MGGQPRIRLVASLRVVLEHQDAGSDSSETRILEDCPLRTLDIDLDQVGFRQVGKDIARGNFDRAGSITGRPGLGEPVRKQKGSTVSSSCAPGDHAPTALKPVRADSPLEQRAVLRVGLECNKLTVWVVTEEKRAEKADVRAKINTDRWTAQFGECRCRTSRWLVEAEPEDLVEDVAIRRAMAQEHVDSALLRTVAPDERLATKFAEGEANWLLDELRVEDRVSEPRWPSVSS